MTLTEVAAEAVHASCSCGAAPDQPCACAPGVHYSRLVRAETAGYITLTDLGDAIHDSVFGGSDVFAPGGAA
jgi:hypothetical protein